MKNTPPAALLACAPGSLAEAIALSVDASSALAQRTKTVLPELTLEIADAPENALTRRGVLLAKHALGEQRELAFRELRGMPVCAEKDALYRAIQDCSADEHLLEQRLQEQFVPQHGPEQFLSPRAFFVSPLFRVGSKSAKRQQHLELLLPTAPGRVPIRYVGPELRQSDGLVFLALLHMLRDVQAGTAASLPPEAVCKALFGRYDGNTRKALREHIQRLQQGLILSERFSVQLCLRFDYPKVGPWTVGLDAHIVELFRVSPEVWLRLQPRLTLPDGLATWLFAYIESQTKLIPMQLCRLRELCGSRASDKAFSNRMRAALRQLGAQGIIDTGWSVRKAEVRWRKLR